MRSHETVFENWGPTNDLAIVVHVVDILDLRLSFVVCTEVGLVLDLESRRECLVAHGIGIRNHFNRDAIFERIDSCDEPANRDRRPVCSGKGSFGSNVIRSICFNIRDTVLARVFKHWVFFL